MILLLRIYATPNMSYHPQVRARAPSFRTPCLVLIRVPVRLLNKRVYTYVPLQLINFKNHMQVVHERVI